MLIKPPRRTPKENFVGAKRNEGIKRIARIIQLAISSSSLERVFGDEVHFSNSL
ncbi:MAG: hypothetical protein M0C28_10615 [Candidatus Moduliflexus flocculans]|nr:hypothetical protein [Candidatus Moduliflexus flocculans]